MNFFMLVVDLQVGTKDRSKLEFEQFLRFLFFNVSIIYHMLLFGVILLFLLTFALPFSMFYLVLGKAYERINR